MTRLVIDTVNEETVLCFGEFPTHDGKATHSMTKRAIFMDEVEWKREPRIGDEIVIEPGRVLYKHIPRHDDDVELCLISRTC